MTALSVPRARRRWPQRAAGGALLASLMTFGPMGRAEAIATVNVTPNSQLPDPANVNISGNGFSPNRALELYQCVDRNEVELCTLFPIAATTTNVNGNFGPVPAQVKGTFNTEDGAVNCRISNGCRVVAWDDLGHSGSRSISFERFGSK